MSAAMRRRDVSGLLAIALIGLASVTGLIAAGAGGRANFAADPIGALALVSAAVGAAVAGARLSASGADRAAAWSRWLAVAVLIYLASALWAVSSPSHHPVTTIAIAVWSTAWIPPLALGQLVSSSAIREAGLRRPWEHTVLLTAIALAMATNVLLVVPTAPFAGIATIAPESWRVRIAPLGLTVTLLATLALLLLPVRLWWAASTSSRAARARFAVAASGSSAAPLTVAFCLLLAIARRPGGVDPSLGSVAFLVALAAAVAVGDICAVLASRRVLAPRHLTIVVRGTGLAAAGLLVLGLGTLVAAPGLGLGATAIAAAIAGATVVLIGGTWFGTGKLARSLLTVVAQPAADTGKIPQLTQRENEVLALLAEGASNAGIAQQLVISTRTVDAHLRAIFAKLDLTGAGEQTNRRVRAARIWLDAQI